MEGIEEIREGAELILRNINELNNLISVEEAIENAPGIVHDAFCRELVRLAKTKPNPIPKSDPEMMKVLEHIEFLEKIYPKLKGL